MAGFLAMILLHFLQLRLKERLNRREDAQLAEKRGYVPVPAQTRGQKRVSRTLQTL